MMNDADGLDWVYLFGELYKGISKQVANVGLQEVTRKCYQYGQVHHPHLDDGNFCRYLRLSVGH